MKITALKLTKKNKVAVYANGEYVLSLPSEVILKFNLKVGSDLNKKDIDEIFCKAELHKAKEKALNILSYRARSCGELRKKLKENFSEECVDLAVEDLKKVGLLDDEKFSIDYALHLYKNKGYGIKRIIYELKNKLVDSEIISKVLSDLNLDESLNIEKVFKKKNFTNLKDEKSKRRAISYLTRLGYSWEHISRIFK